MKELIAKGDLNGAREAAIAAVKSNPGDISARVALLQVFCFTGELDRAEKQLDPIAGAGMEQALLASGLLALIKAEQHRHKVHAGEMGPGFITDKPESADAYLDLLKRRTSGADDLAGESDALEANRPHSTGTWNGEAFDDLRDGDDGLAPYFEAVAAQGYVWVPMDGVASIKAQPPKNFIDLFWFPVELVLKSGDELGAHLPALYVGSHASEDSQLQLGHSSDWIEDSGLVRGVGRRVLFAGGEPVDLLGLREVTFAN